MSDGEPTPPTEEELATLKRRHVRHTPFWPDVCWECEGEYPCLTLRLIHALEQALAGEAQEARVLDRVVKQCLELKLGLKAELEQARSELEKAQHERDDLRAENSALLEALKRAEQERDEARNSEAMTAQGIHHSIYCEQPGAPCIRCQLDKAKEQNA